MHSFNSLIQAGLISSNWPKKRYEATLLDFDLNNFAFINTTEIILVKMRMIVEITILKFICPDFDSNFLIDIIFSIKKSTPKFRIVREIDNT